jgi:hypothetical protein
MCPNGTQNQVDGNVMCPNGTQNQVDGNVMCPNGTQILPTNERQVRPLTKLEPEQQVEAWQLSVKQAGGKVPSGRIVTNVVQRIMERTKVANPYRVGEVCLLLPKDNPDLRGKGKCWCIVTAVNDFSCTVTTWEKEYTIRVDHLKSFEYLDSDCLSMQQISERIKKLRENPNLEEAAIAHLKHLGEIKRPYLTPFEEKILTLMEQELGT